MATSAAIINALKDSDLRERAVAIAAEQGVTAPQSWIDQRLPALACAPVNDGGDTVASVYEYAEAQYQTKAAALKRPGKDPSAVTDDHLRHAIKALKDGEQS